MYIRYENLRKYHVIAHRENNVILHEKQRCFNTDWPKCIFAKNKMKAIQEILKDVKSEHFAFGFVWLKISIKIFSGSSQIFALCVKMKFRSIRFQKAKITSDSHLQEEHYVRSWHLLLR